MLSEKSADRLADDIAGQQQDIDERHVRVSQLAEDLLSNGRIEKNGHSITLSDVVTHFELQKMDKLPLELLASSFTCECGEKDVEFMSTCLELIKECAYEVVNEECEELKGWE